MLYSNLSTKHGRSTGEQWICCLMAGAEPRMRVIVPLVSALWMDESMAVTQKVPYTVHSQRIKIDIGQDPNGSSR